MNTQEILDLLQTSPRRSPARAYLWVHEPLAFPRCHVFSAPDFQMVWGDWADMAPVLQANAGQIAHMELDLAARNSVLPLLDYGSVNARIEPGAILRRGAQIADGAVIMMGAVVNIGASVGRGTLVDMNAVLGARAAVGENCHIGAGAVLAGVLEPVSAAPVVVEDAVLIGANAVILEGCRVGRRAVVAAGAVVTADVPENAVVAGSPAKFIKFRDEKTDQKTLFAPQLRKSPLL